MKSLTFSASKPGLLANRYVRTILLSNVLLQLGIWVRNFAILLYVADVTNNDPYSISLISIVEFAPIFVFSMIGGTFADRWRPKRTMVWCDLMSAVSVFVVLAAILFGSWQAVFLATFVSAVLSQFSQPAGMKLFKRHVEPEKLQGVMAMFQTLMAIFMILGPILGTFVYEQWGIGVSIAVMGFMFLASAAVLASLPRDERETVERRDGFLRELAAGFRYVGTSRVLLSLGGSFAAAGLAVGLLQPLGIYVAVENLGRDKAFLQWLLAVNGAAMLAGGSLAMGLARRIKPALLLILGMTVSAVCTVGIGWSTLIPLTLALQAVNGLFFPCIHIGINTLILQQSEEAFVGRVIGTLNPMFMGMMVIGMSCAGLLKSALSLGLIYSAAGALFLAGTAVLAPILRLSGSRAAASPTAAD
ncbi:MAG TPA: MFS transporter [Paenibacillaceae bacterium]